MLRRPEYVWALLLLLFIPLHDTYRRSAEASYDRAWTLFEHGRLTDSQHYDSSIWRDSIDNRIEYSSSGILRWLERPIKQLKHSASKRIDLAPIC